MRNKQVCSDAGILQAGRQVQHLCSFQQETDVLLWVIWRLWLKPSGKCGCENSTCRRGTWSWKRSSLNSNVSSGPAVMLSRYLQACLAMMLISDWSTTIRQMSKQNLTYMFCNRPKWSVFWSTANSENFCAYSHRYWNIRWWQWPHATTSEICLPNFAWVGNIKWQLGK